MMSDYRFSDKDVEKIVSQECMGKSDSYELVFFEPIGALNINKDDVVHLAKLVGLVVCEQDSAL